MSKAKEDDKTATGDPTPPSAEGEVGSPASVSPPEADDGSGLEESQWRADRRKESSPSVVSGWQDPPPPSAATFDPHKHKATTAKALAITLLGILGGTVLLHYLALICLSHLHAADDAARKARIEPFVSAFNAWLPVLSGLVSGACTYYFTRDREGK